jgi:NADH-quinone oxidoreductase subunit G
MVEIEGMPNPQIACNTAIKDGLVVKINSPKAIDARKWTLEFLLANHPLDCPICDKAGECELQNYTYKYGKTHTDFVEQKRTPATVQLSERLWIEKDRCIVCLRCVQFLREVGGKEELYVKQRGNAAEITCAPGKPVESPYQINTVDLCPVGALSPNNFRFAERVWNLKKYDSICPMCPRGCNTTVEVKNSENQVYRVTPRLNAEVNSYWMCDKGREHFTQNHTGR